MTRDAEMAARDFLRLVLGGLPAEDDISMVQTLLARASLAIDAYGDPAFRAQAHQQLTDGVFGLMQSAPAGSDHQLALLYTYATAEDPAGLDRVRAILDGQEQLPGLELDTELRWHLLIELAAHGRATNDDIAAELARDATAAGEKRAASARIGDSDGRRQGGGVGGRRGPRRPVQPHAGGDDAHVLALRAGAARGHRAVHRQVLRRRR